MKGDMSMVLMIACGVLALAVVGLTFMVLTLKKTFQSLVSGARGENLERLLLDHMAERSRVDATLQQHASQLESLESKMESTKRYLGIHRYDAFDDVGGEQSFALALYDEHGHGAVISSIVGRSTNRVYCKEIVGGKATKDLSKEEEQAIELAAKNRAKLLQSTRG